MEQKRSKGVTFWGWLLIILSALGFLGLINPGQQISTYGVKLFSFQIVSGVAYIICGAFVLRLNENARKAAIILGLISILAIPFYIKPVFKTINSEVYYLKAQQKIIEQAKPQYQQQALANLERAKESVKRISPIIIIMFALLILVLELIPICFFIHPKVKEQFK